MAKAKTAKKMAVKEVETVSDEGSSVDNDDFENGDDAGSNFENDISSDGYDDSENDNEEMLDENKSKKRKYTQDDTEVPIKKQKKNKKKNVKPPTAEEILTLRETENLFQSNLFRLQIDEMLSELKPKKSVKRYINPWIENFSKFLINLKDGESHDLTDTKWVKKFNIEIPLSYKTPEKGKGVFMFKPPVEIFPIGSHSMSCPIGPFYRIDLAVVMPKTFLLTNDNLNQKYHLKRALYLCYIAGMLKDNELLSKDHTSQFMYMSEDKRKPLLVLYPSGKLSKFISICLHPIPETNSFMLKRFLPSKNNIRPEWWGLDKDILPPTPSYNASILEDMVLRENHLVKKEIFDQNQNFKDAFVLLRVWLKQREMNEGFGAFNSHLLSMLLVYLLKINKINKHMSSYQIIRHVWLYLGDSDWLENGPSLCDVKVEKAPTQEEFHVYYDLVFIDSTGYFNMAANLNKYIYLFVKEESKLAVQHLDNLEISGFRALFMVKMPFIRQNDVVLRFNDLFPIEKTANSKGDKVTLMDLMNNPVPEFLRLMCELFEKGIGHRLKNMRVQLSALGLWDIDAGIPEFGKLSIGMNLNSNALSLIDKGPEPNDPEAEEFREFWGNKCDLRRFKDGTICESVVWEEKKSSIENRRAITHRIILYLLKEKYDFHSFHILSKSFQDLVTPKICKVLADGREETCKQILSAYEDLSRQLRDLPDLPLSIVSVHCISPAYRFTEPFPPAKPLFHRNIFPLITDPVKGRLFPEDGKVGKYPPDYTAPIDCIVQMALTQKWPDDVNAGKRLIAAFNIAITAALKKHCNLSCQITADYFVVNKDGYLFRLYLGYSKEIGLLKLKISDEGVRQYRETPESLALEKKFINLPKITGALYRLSEEYPGFSSATCLAKRWLSSQLLDDTHFPTILIEMIMAFIFINPQPYTPCLSVLPSFLRFLTFLSTTDWSITPVIVNFNSILTRDEIKEIEDAFRDDRTSFPPLFLASPYDKTGSLWSKSAPSLPTLVRLTKLAGASLHIVESNICDSISSDNVLKIFQPPMGVYDVVINLNKAFQFRSKESLFYDTLIHIAKHVLDKNPVLPILDFNPVDLYLADLRKNYSSFALFFHDSYGGHQIGVLFKPNFLEDIQFQNSLPSGRKPLEINGKITLKPHIDSILEGFKIIGNGIVESIELKKLKEKSIETLVYK